MKRMRFMLGLFIAVLLVVALALPTAVLAEESAATTAVETSAEEATAESAAATAVETSAEEATAETAEAAQAETSVEEATAETAAETEAETSPDEEAPESAPPTEPGTTPEEESPESPPSTEPGTAQVEIDIKPGSDPNSINLKSKGVVPVAVLTADDFDASTVDPSTVEFAGASPVRWTMEDVDGDGDLDLILHFKTQELGLTEDSTESTLTGETYDGELLWGTDTVNIVPKGK